MARFINIKPDNDNDKTSGTLVRLELTSVKALISYTAYEKQLDENTITEMVQTKFGARIEDLPRKVFEDVIRYLVDGEYAH